MATLHLCEILLHEFVLLPLVAPIQRFLPIFKIYSVLPKGLNKTLMRTNYGFQALDGLLQLIDSVLEHIGFEFQSLDLIFEALDYCYIATCGGSICHQKGVEQDLL